MSPACRVRSRPVGRIGELPDDVLFAIFLRLPGVADVARCAATCRRWGRVVAAFAPAISRALPPTGRFLPHLALGFVHRQQKRARAPTQLRFVPPAFAARLLPAGGPRLVDQGSRPVASRNGRVVLEIGRARGGLTTLSVWNPMTGDVSALPPLTVPGDYACGLLTGDDLDDNDDASAFFFRVLLVYNRHSFTALRCYSSDAGSWGPEAAKPGAKISKSVLRGLGSVVVLRGVAYWPMHDAAIGVRLDGGTPPPMEVSLLPYRLMVQTYADDRVLGVSPDGGTLRYLGIGFVARTLLSISYVGSQLFGPGYRSTTGGFWDAVHDQHIHVPEITVTTTTTFKMRWFGEKSGTLLFTVGDAAAGANSAVFALNVATGSLQKLAEGDGYHACRDMCGYEMDRAALLASVAPR